jgi:hypothetical protein
MDEKTCNQPKPFDSFTKVVNGLTDIVDLDKAMTYAKFYYEAEKSIEDNINNITKIIKP